MIIAKLLAEAKARMRGRRLCYVNAYIENIRKGTDAEKRIFLEHCIKNAYYPLYLAFTTLEAANFVSGEIVEETTGERFRLELRKILTMAEIAARLEKEGGV